MARRSAKGGPPSRNGGNGNGDGSSRVVHDPKQTEMALEQFELLRARIDASGQTNVKLLGDIATTLQQLSEGGGIGGGGVGGVVIGPQGRPIMPPDQSRRPTTGQQGYPGGTGYGAQGLGSLGRGLGDMPPMVGNQFVAQPGLFGSTRASVANWINQRSGLAQGGATEHRQNADHTFTPLDENGDPLTDQDGQEIRLSRQAMRARVEATGRAARVAGSRGIAGTIKGALGEAPMVAKVGGTALAGAEVAYKYGQFIGNQRSANAAYQSIYGPGTSGWDQRVNNFGYRFRNWGNNFAAGLGIGSGGLSDQDADRSFKAVSAMGFQGSDRNQMLAWTRGNFNQVGGMSVDQSTQLLGINAKEAATNLSELRNQLKGVSEMAQQAGQSAQVFRQSFIQNYGAAVSGGFAGGSGAIATAQVASTVGQGRLFAGLNTSSMYGSMGAQQVLANRVGMGSVLDFELASASNPMVIANAQQTQLNQVFLSVVSADERSLIERSIAKHGGAQNVATNQNAAREVVSDVEHQRPGGLNAWAIRSAMMAAQISGAESLDATALSIYYVQWVAKQGRNFTDPTAKVMAASDQRSLSVKQAAMGALGRGKGGSSTNLGYLLQGGTGHYDPVIGKMQAAGVNAVEVQTKQGSEIVSLKTAAAQYRDQLTSGSAVIMSGPDAGKSVGTAYGTEQHARYRDTTSSKAKDSLNGLDPNLLKRARAAGLTDQQISFLAHPSGGMSGIKEYAGLMQQIKTGHPAGTGASGTITVGLKPDVAKYLEISTTGDSLVNQAAASGGPPTLTATGSSTGH